MNLDIYFLSVGLMFQVYFIRIVLNLKKMFEEKKFVFVQGKLLVRGSIELYFFIIVFWE